MRSKPIALQSEAGLLARRRQKRAASHALVAEAAIAAFASALHPYVAVGITSQRRMGMPRIQMDFFHPANTLFTVDRTVGRNAPNDRLDVFLVQLLLFLCTKNEISIPQVTVPRGLRVATPVAGATTPARPRPQGNIIIDGICGDQTIGFIEYFQAMMMLKQVSAIEINGQVGTEGSTAATKTMYMLNATVNALTRPWVVTQSDAFPYQLRDSFYFSL